MTQNKHPLHRGGAEAARRTHNPEVTRSRRVPGIHPIHRVFRLLYQKQVVKASDSKQAPIHRRGAPVARRAHNPEVAGSIPVAGIHPIHRVFRPFKEAGTTYFTGIV